MKTRVAVIAIIVDDNAASGAINRLLHEAADFVIGRMGIPYREKHHQRGGGRAPGSDQRAFGQDRAAARRQCQDGLFRRRDGDGR